MEGGRERKKETEKHNKGHKYHHPIGSDDSLLM